MFGGTAQRYCRYEIACEPYKKGNALYVKVIHPATRLPIEVRWYADQKHADLMPKKAAVTAKRSEPKKEKFDGEIFGFQNREDKIIAIKAKDITKDEETAHFLYNWKKGGHWRFNALFGGIWFAQKNEPRPPVAHNRYFEISWPEFVAEAQRQSVLMNPNKSGFWFSQS